MPAEPDPHKTQILMHNFARLSNRDTGYALKFVLAHRGHRGATIEDLAINFLGGVSRERVRDTVNYLRSTCAVAAATTSGTTSRTPVRITDALAFRFPLSDALVREMVQDALLHAFVPVDTDADMEADAASNSRTPLSLSLPPQQPTQELERLWNEAQQRELRRHAFPPALAPMASAASGHRDPTSVVEKAPYPCGDPLAVWVSAWDGELYNIEGLALHPLIATLLESARAEQVAGEPGVYYFYNAALRTHLPPFPRYRRFDRVVLDCNRSTLEFQTYCRTQEDEPLPTSPLLQRKATYLTTHATAHVGLCIHGVYPVLPAAQRPQVFKFLGAADGPVSVASNTGEDESQQLHN